MGERRRCLPVAPSAEVVEVVLVRYCTGEGTDREPAHQHTAIYTTGGTLIAEECSWWPRQATTVGGATCS